MGLRFIFILSGLHCANQIHRGSGDAPSFSRLRQEWVGRRTNPTAQFAAQDELDYAHSAAAIVQTIDPGKSIRRPRYFATFFDSL